MIRLIVSTTTRRRSQTGFGRVHTPVWRPCMSKALEHETLYCTWFGRQHFGDAKRLEIRLPANIWHVSRTFLTNVWSSFFYENGNAFPTDKLTESNFGLHKTLSLYYNWKAWLVEPTNKWDNSVNSDIAVGLYALVEPICDVNRNCLRSK